MMARNRIRAKLRLPNRFQSLLFDGIFNFDLKKRTNWLVQIRVLVRCKLINDIQTTGVYFDMFYFIGGIGSELIKDDW
jgi:hypothetical protein